MKTRALSQLHARTGLFVFAGVCLLLLILFVETSGKRASFVALFSGEFQRKLSSVRILFTGDAMFDRTVRTKALKEGHSFLLSPLFATFKEHDVVLINVEGPITSFASLSQFTGVGDLFNTRFTFDPKVIEVLTGHGIIAHLGNNHIWDFGPDGIAQTKQYLTRAEVPFFGDSNGSIPETEVRDVNGMKIGFVSYNEFAGGSKARALASLTSLSEKTDFQILYAHWGEEYQNTPTPAQVLLARQFVDAGADIVVGSHPHVVQVHENYKGSPIYYSLGNLVFDQYWEPAVRCGAMLSVEIADGEVTSEKLIPVRMEKTRQTVVGECI